MTLRLVLLCVFCFHVVVFCRRHTLSLKGDNRQIILASRFGYASGGYLLVEVNGLPKSLLNQVGFILDRTTNANIDTRDKSKLGHCMLTSDFLQSEPDSVVILKFGRTHGRLLHGSNEVRVHPTNFNTVFGLKFVDDADRNSLESLVEPVARFLQTEADMKLGDARDMANTILQFVRNNPTLLADVEKIVDVGGEKAVYNLLNAFLEYHETSQRIRRSVTNFDQDGKMQEKPNLLEDNQVEDIVKKNPNKDQPADGKLNKKGVVDSKAAERKVDAESNGAPRKGAVGANGGNDAAQPKAAVAGDAAKPKPEKEQKGGAGGDGDSGNAAVQLKEVVADDAAKWKPEKEQKGGAGGDGDGGNAAVQLKEVAADKGKEVAADDAAKRKPKKEQKQKQEARAADHNNVKPKAEKEVAPVDEVEKQVNPPKEDLLNEEEKKEKAAERPGEPDSKQEVAPAEKPKPAVPPKVIEAAEIAVKVFSQVQPVFPYLIKGGLVSANFTINFTSPSSAGSYDFYFHSCAEAATDVSITMTEKNPGSYLSVGEQPLCMLYVVFGAIYFLLSFIWIIHLRLSKAPVFRIHYLMFAMIFVKACSLAFHAINFYVIGRHGVPEEGWAVMYYISHMTRGFLLFVTILMIGAGWTFIKHVFSRREKHLFAIIIPLQVLANVATIVMEESEQGDSRYLTWKEIFTVVDLVCCVIILFPVIWSIRHLQAAAQSDGKAAQNLRKLRLFRHFYIMVICYIYFTRIIVYLLKLTIPAHLNWLVELFQELVTLVFLVSIGYKFRPFNDNPYLQVPSDDDEDTLLERFDLEEVWSQSGLTDGVTRLHRPQAVNAALSSRKQKADRAGGLEAGLAADAGDSDLMPLIRP